METWFPKHRFGNTRPNAPKAIWRIQATMTVLPIVVWEHFVLKERLRKQETLTRTVSCGCAKPGQMSPLPPGPHMPQPPTCSATPTPSLLSFKQWHWVALGNSALKKLESTTCGKCLLSAAKSHKRKLLRTGETGNLSQCFKNYLFGEPSICFAVAAWFSSYYF